MKRYFPFIFGVAAGMLLAVVFFVGRASASTGCFTDTNGHLFETFICWMKDNGITNGYGDGTYGPNDYITRGQMAVFMQRTAALTRGTGTQFDGVISGTAVAPDASGDFATVTITAPFAGRLLVNGSLNLYCAGFLTSCVQSLGNTYVNVNGTNYNRQYYSIDGGGDNSVNTAAWNSSNTAYIPVPAGTYTVSLRVLNSSGSSGDTYVWSGGINVLFVPFDGSGAQSSPTMDGALTEPDVKQGLQNP